MGYFGEIESWIEYAKFFKLVNDWFDCLNVRVPHSDTRERVHAYGLHLDLQNGILDEMSNIMRGMNV
ncbi:hypothetical protein HUJ05_006901 [Dendroctonus ponderosae]|nr:hypothetical protein HUJ05_006901 [Dendroctonus ponderosae]